jgi:RNA polymerase sigma factor (sigma-70 family)
MSQILRCASFQKGDLAACQLALQKARQGARKILGYSHEPQVEDVAQDAVRELWEQRTTLRPQDELGAIAYVRGRSRAMNYLRNRRRERAHLLQLQTALEHPRKPNPHIFTQHERACLERFVESEGGQLALENAHGKRMREIAQERGIALERVHAKITTARKDLMTCLGLDPNDSG